MILDTVQLIHNMSINPIIKFGTARYNIYMCIARGQPCFATSPNWRQMWLAPWPLSFQCNLFTYFSIWYGQVLLQSNPVILRRKFRWVHIFEDGIQGYHIKYTYNVTICIASVLLWVFFFFLLFLKEIDASGVTVYAFRECPLRQRIDLLLKNERKKKGTTTNQIRMNVIYD